MHTSIIVDLLKDSISWNFNSAALLAIKLQFGFLFIYNLVYPIIYNLAYPIINNIVLMKFFLVSSLSLFSSKWFSLWQSLLKFFKNLLVIRQTNHLFILRFSQISFIWSLKHTKSHIIRESLSFRGFCPSSLTTCSLGIEENINRLC